MGILNRKLKLDYTPLELPGWGNFPLANVRKANVDAGAVIAKTVNEWIENFGIDGLESQFPVFSLLHSRLLDSFTIDLNVARATIAAEVDLPMMIGYLYGDIEVNSGTARDGLKETNYWMSMTTFWYLLQNPESAFGTESQFGMCAAYYVARTGSTSVDSLIRRTPGYWKAHPNQV